MKTQFKPVVFPSKQNRNSIQSEKRMLTKIKTKRGVIKLGDRVTFKSNHSIMGFNAVENKYHDISGMQGIITDFKQYELQDRQIQRATVMLKIKGQTVTRFGHTDFFIVNGEEK